MSNSPADGLPNATRSVQEWLSEHGYPIQVVELPGSTRSSAEAAQSIGCDIGQIVKSLVFKTVATDQPILILASGKNRVNEKRISRHLGETLEKADADFVRRVTGFSIGGVPPIGHAIHLTPLIDLDLLQYDEIWAAAGTPISVFRISPDQLVQMSGGEVMPIA